MLNSAPSVCTDTAASIEARTNWESNLGALAVNQPWLPAVLGDLPADVEWVHARDGSLTSMQNGRWWAGCSVPLLAGRTLLKTLSDDPIGSCQLAPAHAGLVRAARECTGKCPVLFVIQPDLRTAQMILAGSDFSRQIAEHRTWFAAGPTWLEQLQQIFIEHSGLATPLRFIRTRLTGDEITLPMIKAIQDMLGVVLSKRADEVNRLKGEATLAADNRTILLVGGSQFRLWDFGTKVLHQQVATDGITIRPFDLDDALSGSPHALLRASQGCGAIVSANVCRADCNGLISTEIPWVTWMTQPGAPRFETAGPKDLLILADAQWRGIAKTMGWPAERMQVCGWPQMPVPGCSCDAPTHLGILCDARKIETPESVADFSSHRLLWELIEEELATNPLVVEDVDAYLTNRAGQMNIATHSLDRRTFIEGLVIPAYQHGLARMLMAAGLPIRIWGKGWGNLPEFVPVVGGAILDQAEFDAAIRNCKALVYCWPARAADAMELTGKPIVYRSGMDQSALLRAARWAAGAREISEKKPAADGLRKLILTHLQSSESGSAPS